MGRRPGLLQLRLGVYLDEDFNRRGPRAGLGITLFTALVIMLFCAALWVSR